MKHNHCRGMTLIEILVALTILAVMLTLTAVSFENALTRSRQRGLAHALVNALTQTRMEAVKRNTWVSLCPSTDQHTCAPNVWEQGWIIFADPNHNGVRDEEEPIVIRQGPDFANLTARGNAPVAAYVSFRSNGIPRTKNGGLQMGTFTICGRRPEAIKVVMAISGKARMERSDSGC